MSLRAGAFASALMLLAASVPMGPPKCCEFEGPAQSMSHPLACCTSMLPCGIQSPMAVTTSPGGISLLDSLSPPQIDRVSDSVLRLPFQVVSRISSAPFPHCPSAHGLCVPLLI